MFINFADVWVLHNHMSCDKVAHMLAKIGAKLGPGGVLSKIGASISLASGGLEKKPAGVGSVRFYSAAKWVCCFGFQGRGVTL